MSVRVAAVPRRRVGRGAFITSLLLAPPLLWLGVVYLGSLLGLLLYGFYSIDDFTAQVVQKFTWATFASLFTTPSNREGIQVGAAIALMVKQPGASEGAALHYRDLWGTGKHTQLEAETGGQIAAEYGLI